MTYDKMAWGLKHFKAVVMGVWGLLAYLPVDQEAGEMKDGAQSTFSFSLCLEPQLL